MHGEQGPKVNQMPEVRGEARGLVLARLDMGARLPDATTSAVTAYIPRVPTPEVSVSIRDRTIGNANIPEDYDVPRVKIKLKDIKAGNFLMGSPKDDEDLRANDGPQHEVQITQPFYMGIYPVTQEESVQATSKANPSYFSNLGGGKGDVVGHDTKRFPMESVTCFDAIEFCKA